MSAHGRPPAVELRGISKSFGAVRANRAIDLVIAAGTIHGIIGENGAGKSTLVSILYGFYQADAGEILIDGESVKISSSADAIRRGIGIVHQHFMLVETFTVLENIVLGIEGGAILKGGLAAARTVVAEIGETYGLTVDPDALVSDLSVGQRQRVEIIKALYRQAHILILDEPTGVLTPQEADQLFALLASLRAQGKTVILITHKLREIMAITDSVSVMRQGQMVAHRKTSETTPAELGELMIGRKVVHDLQKSPAALGEVVLRVENLRVADAAGQPRVKGVSFSVRQGEIVGIAGVAGNGQSELLEAIAGIRKPTSGTLRVGEAVLFPSADFSPRQVREHRVAHVPEDRHHRGMVGSFPARENVLLGDQDAARVHKHGLIHWPTVLAESTDKMARFDVRPADPLLKMANFSGGNQQKLILAREMERDPLVLLVGQPTRGVDIGAIEFIHRRLLALRDAGKAILLVSVELDEIMSVADRIVVLCDGEIVGEVNAADANERQLGLWMAGVRDQPGVSAA